MKNRQEAAEEVMACYDLFREAFAAYVEACDHEVHVLERANMQPRSEHSTVRYIPVKINGQTFPLTVLQRDILLHMEARVPTPSGVLTERAEMSRQAVEHELSILFRKGALHKSQRGVYVLEAELEEQPAQPRA